MRKYRKAKPGESYVGLNVKKASCGRLARRPVFREGF